MHKCNNLPRTQKNGVECFLSVEDYMKGRAGCVNWNKVDINSQVMIFLLTSDFSITPDAPQAPLILSTELSLLITLAWPGWPSSWSSLWRDGQMSCTLSRCEEGKELFVMIISLAGLTLILELGILCMPHCGNVYNSN